MMSAAMISLAQMALGLGLFLFGMSELEAGMRQAGYATIKRALRRFTAHRAGAVATGVVVTGIVQSSTMVSLLVLAFASAGLIPLAGAIGVLLGANLGSTVTGWLVTALGFKLPLAQLAIPLLGVGALLRVFVPQRLRGHGIGVLLFGFGLLIYGLGYMKEAAMAATQHWDMASLQGHGAWVYALAGMVLAALLHSSAATTMIALTALDGGVLTLPAAAAMVIGADLGTTNTAIIGSLRGGAIKKQLAFSHCFFNLVVDSAAFFLLLPLLPQALDWAGISDPLYGLVVFHSTINIVGLLLFVPWLDTYTRWVGRLFQPAVGNTSLAQMPVDVPEVALHALRRALDQLLRDAAVLNLDHFGIRGERLALLAQHSSDVLAEGFDAAYEQIKQREADVAALALRLHQQSLTPLQAALLTNQQEAARLAVFAVKALKDIRANLQTLKEAADSDADALLESLCRYQLLFYSEWLALVARQHLEEWIDEQLLRLRSQNDLQLAEANEQAYRAVGMLQRGGLNLSSLLNINREIHLSADHLLQLVPRWQAVLVADTL